MGTILLFQNYLKKLTNNVDDIPGINACDSCLFQRVVRMRVKVIRIAPGPNSVNFFLRPCPVIGQCQIEPSTARSGANDDIGDFVKKFLLLHFPPSVDVAPNGGSVGTAAGDDVGSFARGAQLGGQRVHFFVNAVVPDLVHFGSGASGKADVAGVKVDVGVKTCQKLNITFFNFLNFN